MKQNVPQIIPEFFQRIRAFADVNIGITEYNRI